MLSSIRSFISYWYFRYLLVTELYMVEKWERAMFHIVIFILFAIAYTFNTTVMLGLVRYASKSIFLPGSSKEADRMSTIITN